MKKLFKICFIFIIATGIYLCFQFNIIPLPYFTANDFKIQTLKSKIDCDNDGIDDYTDIFIGARKYVDTKPKYKSEYYAGGYPPDGIGVCTDVVWNAFLNAGYDLKSLVDKDIKNNLSEYTSIEKPDPNIDFRRVQNLKIFFKRNAEELTLDTEKIEEWQPGDIIIYNKHIGILSDKRNFKGKPYLIHNAGQPVLEEDALTRLEIIGHYRWNKDNY